MPDQEPQRKREELRHGQQMAIQRLVEQPHNMMAMGMAIGKTGAVLTAIRDLLDTFQVNHVLVIAPLLVAEETWPDEIETWEHTCVLDYEVVTGAPARRESRAKRLPELTITNVESVVWLVEFWGDDWPYDWVIVDESSKFKNPAKKTKPTKKAVQRIVDETLAALPKDMHPDDVAVAVAKAAKRAPRYPTRFGALCTRLQYTHRFTTMTGTLCPNGLLDLWAQYYLLDRGTRLGSTYSAYRGRWFDGDYMGFKYAPRPGAFEAITEAIRDITISMRTEDYADLPAVLHSTITVKLPPKVMAQYRKFEKTLIWQHGDDDIEAVNNGVLTGKLLQLCNGSIYDEDGQAHEIHALKLEALDRIIEEANGAPVLVAYSYEFDLAKLKKRYPKAEVVGEKPNLQKRWNRGEIPILLAHPASAGHGLNLQIGGYIAVWYGLPWSLEYYLQLNQRLRRPGQPETVIIHHIVAQGTVDERVMAVLPEKEATQDAVIEATRYVAQ